MNILLTGATSGIGFETLKQLVVDSHYIFAIGRDFKKIDSFLESNKSQISIYEYDFLHIDNIEDLFENFFLKDRKLDALIHCAGIEETLPLTFYTPQKVKNLFSINVFSGIELLRNFVKKKNSNDGASIIFLSSVMGSLGQPGKVGYCATKSSLLGIVRSSALEFAKRSIRVNAISPGVVKTPMSESLFSELSQEQVLEIVEMHPLGLGDPGDVVSLILFLISRKARWITGQNFIIDGGYSCR